MHYKCLDLKLKNCSNITERTCGVENLLPSDPGASHFTVCLCLPSFKMEFEKDPKGIEQAVTSVSE